LEPDYAAAHNNLGIALSQAGRLPEAITHLEASLRASPGSAEAHYNLGIALSQAGSGIVLPHGVTVDRAGDLFVTDGIAGTVRMFVPLGSRAVLGATLSHAGNFTAGQPGSKWSVVVSNAVGAGATSG